MSLAPIALILASLASLPGPLHVLLPFFIFSLLSVHLHSVNGPLTASFHPCFASLRVANPEASVHFHLHPHSLFAFLLPFSNPLISPSKRLFNGLHLPHLTFTSPSSVPQRFLQFPMPLPSVSCLLTSMASMTCPPSPLPSSPFAHPFFTTELRFHRRSLYAQVAGLQLLNAKPQTLRTPNGVSFFHPD